MEKDTPKLAIGPEATQDALTEVLRQVARELLLTAVHAELAVFLREYGSLCLPDGRTAVVRNGYLPSRTIQTDIGDIDVRVPKTRDRSGSGASTSTVRCCRRRSGCTNTRRGASATCRRESTSTGGRTGSTATCGWTTSSACW